jgi:hypothetical protein
MNARVGSVIVLASFILGFCVASYVWAITMDRVTAQHRIELECIKKENC